MMRGKKYIHSGLVRIDNEETDWCRKEVRYREKLRACLGEETSMV